VVAVCDPSEPVRDARAAAAGIPSKFADVRSMINAGPLDAAIVCTPTSVREQVILPLLDAGIPVLCEKPFSETYEEASRITRASQAAGVPIAIDQNFRRHFGFSLARDRLAAGSLGKPLHLVQVSNHLRRDTGWRIERRRYVMAVMSIHWFDGYRFMLQDEPESIYCCGVNSPATLGGPDTAISATLTFRSGAVASLNESFSSFTRMGGCTLDCENGGLSIGYERVEEFIPGSDPVLHPNPFDKAEATYWTLEDLLNAAAEGREPETGAADNLKSMQILEAAYRSLSDNRVVNMEEIR